MSKDSFVFDAKITLRFKASAKSSGGSAEYQGLIEFLNEMREMNMLRSWVRYAIITQFKSERRGRAGEFDVVHGGPVASVPEAIKIAKQVSKKPTESCSLQSDPEPDQPKVLVSDFQNSHKPNLTDAERKAELRGKFAIMD